MIGLGPAVWQRVGRWITIGAEFLLAQGIAQVAGMVTGLIYVRTMSVDQYALYAISLTSLTVISIGSDLGLTSSLSYFWRSGLQSGKPIGPKVAAIRRLRSVLLIISMLVAGTMLVSLANRSGVATHDIVMCLAMVAVTGFLQVYSTVSITLMRLGGRQRQTYYCETASALARLAAGTVMIIAGISAAWFGLAGGALGAAIAFLLIRYWSKVEAADHGRDIIAQDWRDIGGYLIPLLPSFGVFLLQDAIVLWFAAANGGSRVVAETFALGRISAIYGVLGMFLVMVVTPRLASVVDNRRLMRLSVFSLAILSVFLLVVMLMAATFPGIFLQLIGAKYSGLTFELLMSLSVSSCAVLTSFFVLTTRVRGWVKLEPYLATLQLAVILLLCSHWSFDSTKSVLVLNLILAVTALVSALATFCAGLIGLDLVASRPRAN